MAKTPGTFVGSIGDSKFYSTADGKIVDEAGKPVASRIAAMFSVTPPAEQTAKKTRAGKLKVAGVLGNTKYYYAQDGSIIDDKGAIAPDRISKLFSPVAAPTESLESKRAEIKEAIAPKSVSIPSFGKPAKALIYRNQMLIKSIADNQLKTSLEYPKLFNAIESAVQTLSLGAELTARKIYDSNREFQEALLAKLSGQKAPTRAAGATTSIPKSRPGAPPPRTPTRSRGGAPTSISGRRAAERAQGLAKQRSPEVMARAERMAQIRKTRMARGALIGGALGLGAGAAAASLYDIFKTPSGGGGGATPSGGGGVLGGGTPPASTPQTTTSTGATRQQLTEATEGAAAAPSKQVGDGISITTLKTKSGKSFQVNSKYAKNFAGFIADLEATGYQIREIGGYRVSNIAGTNTPSWHGLGVAIDINPTQNPVTEGTPGRKPTTDMPANINEIANKWGFGWGGAWTGSKQDAMHFSMGEGPGAAFRGNRAAVVSGQEASTYVAGAIQTAPETAQAARPMGAATGEPVENGRNQAVTFGPGTGATVAAPGGAPTVKTIAQYIVDKAKSMGVDPNLALGIAAYEGLNPNTIGSPTFGNRDARGYSFGPYQLYSGSPDPNKIAPGGMAAEFQQRYGEPPKASNWNKQVDFSLELMKRRGPAGLERGPWYAVRDRGGVANISRLGSQWATQNGITPGAGAAAGTPEAAGVPGAATGEMVTGGRNQPAAPAAAPGAPTAQQPGQQGQQQAVSGFSSPIDGARMSSGFGQRWGRLHAGLDYAAPTGTPIKAAAPGIVVRAGPAGAYGNLVEIRHADGTHTRYAHMSAFNTTQGATVSQGQVIGLVGNTGRSTGPHLHFEIRKNGGTTPVDPRTMLGGATPVAQADQAKSATEPGVTQPTAGAPRTTGTPAAAVAAPTGIPGLVAGDQFGIDAMTAGLAILPVIMRSNTVVNNRRRASGETPFNMAAAPVNPSAAMASLIGQVFRGF